MKSNCCHADIEVGGCTTHYYICLKCKHCCDYLIEENKMNCIEQEALAVANILAPQAPAVEIVEAVMKTAVDPNPENLLNDVKLAISLVSKLKEELTGAHPSVIELIKLLF